QSNVETVAEYGGADIDQRKQASTEDHDGRQAEVRQQATVAARVRSRIAACENRFRDPKDDEPAEQSQRGKAIPIQDPPRKLFACWFSSVVIFSLIDLECEAVNVGRLA